MRLVIVNSQDEFNFWRAYFGQSQWKKNQIWVGAKFSSAHKGKKHKNEGPRFTEKGMKRVFFFFLQDKFDINSCILNFLITVSNHLMFYHYLLRGCNKATWTSPKKGLLDYSYYCLVSRSHQADGMANSFWLANVQGTEKNSHMTFSFQNVVPPHNTVLRKLTSVSQRHIQTFPDVLSPPAVRGRPVLFWEKSSLHFTCYSCRQNSQAPTELNKSLLHLSILCHTYNWMFR